MFTLRVAKPQPEYVTYRERYKVDLSMQMAECEANYVRLNKLLANHLHMTSHPSSCPSSQPTNDDYCFMVGRHEQQWLNVLHVLERSPYTTTLQLTQSPISSQVASPQSPWLQMPRLTVRMYHDAKLAEVLAWDGHKRLRPRYEYPNTTMYYADEKLQINQFLGELLSQCLREGYSLENVIPPQRDDV